MSATTTKPVAALWADPHRGLDFDNGQIEKLDTENLRRLKRDVRFLVGVLNSALALRAGERRLQAEAAIAGRRQLASRGMAPRKAQL